MEDSRTRLSHPPRFQRNEFFEKLHVYGIDHTKFAKPVESLIEELERGEAEIYEVTYQGCSRLMALRRSVVIDLTYLNPKDLKTYRFGETYREFPDGRRDYRWPKGEQRLSETIRGGDREDARRAALRCLAEEAGIVMPDQRALLPISFDERNVIPSSGMFLIEHFVDAECRESTAHEGFLSGYMRTRYAYNANALDWDGGHPHISVDEYSVTTYGEWYPID